MAIGRVFTRGVGPGGGGVPYLVTRGLVPGAATLALRRSAGASVVITLLPGDVVRLRAKRLSGTADLNLVSGGTNLTAEDVGS